jgi:FMN phosphatase YigB (HAD superfamily)
VEVKAIVFDVGETLVDEARHAASGDPMRPFALSDLHDDAVPCLEALRRRGMCVGAAGNMRAVHEDFLSDRVDFVGSSERWGVAKPAPEFFARICETAGFDPPHIAYVGDRVDNDVAPALAFGMQAVHIKRGPWGHLHETPAGARRIDSLLELV